MIKILKFFFLCGTILTLLLGRGYAAVPIPSTPPGAALSAWLTAYNSGDAKLAKAFYDSIGAKVTIEEMQKTLSMTGELVLLRITVDEKFEIQALLKASKTGTRCRVRFRFDEKKPSAIRDFFILIGVNWPFPK